MIDNHIIPGLGHIALQKLTPQHIQAFYSTLLEEGLSHQTVSSVHAILLRSLKNATRWNLVSRNVASLVSPPQAERHEGGVLSPGEAKKVLDTVRGNRMFAIILIAVTTGMRRGEILALHWNDFDLKKGALYVHRTVNNFHGYGFRENDTKTKAGRQKITLPKVVLEALVEHKESQDGARERAGSKWTEQNLVFCSRTGGYVQPGYVRLRFHDLRHSAATILLTLGVHPKVVQELLGHSSIAITMNVYSHLLPSMQSDAMGMVNTVFEDERGEGKEGE